MNQLMTVDKLDQLYARMQHAVGKCYTIDDCEGIAVQADAIAAYFKQIKDDDLVKKFLAVKVRAWRKVGEILLTVDASDCESKSAQIRKVRKHFADDPSVKSMSDTVIGNALKLGELPADFFEQSVGQNPNIYAILHAYQAMMRQEWEATPEGRKELARQAEASRIYAERDAAQAAKRAEADAIAQEAKADIQKRLDQQYLDHEAMEAARAEVGYTMDRRDRERMKEVVFLIKAPIHDTLRKAAFDRRITMQAILRAGLAMWLLANDYPFEQDDMFAHPKPKKAA